MNDLIITPEILRRNGFIEYFNGDEENSAFSDMSYPTELPNKHNDNRVFIERKINRNAFIIVLSDSIIPGAIEFDIYVQKDVGCGLTGPLPLRWTELTVGTLNHLYQAFMGKDLIVK